MPVDPRALAALPPFRDVEPDVIAALASRAIERRFAGDEVLFSAGSTPPGMYIVLEGQVRVVRSSGGRQHVIHTEGPGGTLAEVPLFAGGTLPATAIAVEPSRCALLTRDALLHAITVEPRVALALLGRLATRVRELVRRLDDRSTRGVTARVAEFLLARPRGPHPDRISLGMTQIALAEELGTVREVVVRSLLALRRRGAITPLGGGRYEITDREELRRAADE